MASDDMLTEDGIMMGPTDRYLNNINIEEQSNNGEEGIDQDNIIANGV